MTTPAERTRAVLGMAEIARAVCRVAQGKDSPTVRVPRALIEEMRAALRHYPTRTDLALAARESHIFGDPK